MKVRTVLAYSDLNTTLIVKNYYQQTHHRKELTTDGDHTTTHTHLGDGKGQLPEQQRSQPRPKVEDPLLLQHLLCLPDEREELWAPVTGHDPDANSLHGAGDQAGHHLG